MLMSRGHNLVWVGLAICIGDRQVLGNLCIENVNSLQCIFVDFWTPRIGWDVSYGKIEAKKKYIVKDVTQFFLVLWMFTFEYVKDSYKLLQVLCNAVQSFEPEVRPLLATTSQIISLPDLRNHVHTRLGTFKPCNRHARVLHDSVKYAYKTISFNGRNEFLSESNHQLLLYNMKPLCSLRSKWLNNFTWTQQLHMD